MLPYKINTDLDPSTAPENSSRLNVNINIDILKASVTNEQGFDILSLTSESRDIVGNCMLPDSSVCLFSIIYGNPDYRCEIGILKDNKYSVILRDNLLTFAEFGFSNINLIQATSKVNFNGDYVVYWVDGTNSDKWLNLTNLQVDVTTDLKVTNPAQLNLMLGFTPTISDLPDNSTTVIDSGALQSGVYYLTLLYGDKFQNFTKTSLISSPIPVVQSSGPFDTQYIGSSAGTLTNKAISVNLASSEINTEYDYIKVIVISKINQALAAYEFATYPISGGDFNCVVDTLVNKTEVSIDSIIINNAGYNSALTLTQLDDVLYKAHLRDRETIDLQPYVNNIKVNYVQKEIDLSGTNAGDNFRDPNLCFYSKGFMYDEVYALYVSFIIEDDGEFETKAYHIPGRPAVNIDLGGANNPSENDLIADLVATDYDVTLGYPDVVNRFLSIDSTNSKVFHAIATNDNPLAVTNMGYWENKDEVYASSTRWSTKDINGNIVSTDLQGANVRHHKFPEAYNHDAATLTPDLAKSIHPDTSATPNYNIVNLLGIQLSDIVIPIELTGKVKRVNIYYAKRDLTNRTVLGQSLLQSLSQIHVGNSTVIGNQNTVWNNPGQLVAYNLINSPNVKTSGLFPVGYERTTAQSYLPAPSDPSYPNAWMYSDQSRVQPTFWGKGFYKFKSFDLMSQNVDVNSAVYIKNLYRVKSNYLGTILGGDLNDPNSGMYTGFVFDPTDSTSYSSYSTYSYYDGIDRIVDESGSSYESLANYIRVVNDISYVNQNFPNQRGLVFTSPYPFTAIPFNYQGKTGVWMETDDYLYSWDRTALFNQVGNDFPYISYYNNGAFGTDVANGLYVSPYISNLCTFKLNIFQSFDNQVLCLSSSLNLADAETEEIYNADTFTTVNSDIDGIDMSAYSPQGVPLASTDDRPQNQLRSIHCYITQSTANPNYRYEGDNSWETFYPYSTVSEVFSIPQSNPEWYGYNVDYSAVNDIKQPVITSNFPDQTQTYFPNRVIRSAKDNPELQQDNYLDYQAGDYKDFGKIKGKIRNITNQNNKLLIKTDNALYATLGREVLSTENAEANVTSGDIFAVKPREIVSSNSYGGGLGRFADIVTQYGYFYPDTTNGIVYNFSGESLDEISKAGKQIFFRNELKFKLPKKLDSSVYSGFPIYNPSATYNFTDFYVTYNNKVWQPTTTGIFLGTPGISTDWVEVDYRFKNIDSIINGQSIGVQAVFDYKYRRYILTKKDYDYNGSLPETYIGNLPDTYSSFYDGKIVWSNGIFYSIYGVIEPVYAPANSVFLGYRSDGMLDLAIYGVEIDFVEDFYFTEERFTVAYYPEAQGWASYYTFYPDAFAYTIDGVYSFTKEYDTKMYKHNSDLQNSLFYNREVPYQSFVEPILNQPKGVNRTSSFSIKANSYRKDNTLDYLDMFDSYFVRNSYQISEEATVVNDKTSRNAEGYFNINDFRDMTRDNAKPLMTDAIINEPNTSNINANKHWSKQKKFVDYYIIPRLKYNPEFELVDLELSHVSGQINISTDAVLEIGDIIKFVTGGVTYVYVITDATTYRYEVLSVTEATGTFTVSSFYKIPTRELNLLDINTLEHKNTR